MGNRLSSIVTRTGDQGTTSLDGQARLAKSDIKVCAVGELDELGAQIGVAIAVIENATLNNQVQAHPKWQHELIESLRTIQHDLFSAGGSVVMRHSLIDSARVAQMEAQIEVWLKVLPPLKDFILAGGSAGAAQLHMARTLCRRAERVWWQAFHPETDRIAEPIGQYLNRLADWLFVAARLQNRINRYPETLWRNPTRQE